MARLFNNTFSEWLIKFNHHKPSFITMCGTMTIQFSTTAGVMSSMAKHVPHVARTSKNFRYDVVAKAVVSDLFSMSPAVKGLRLRIDNPEFSFKPGQWVDFFIPTVEEVGGFSICSTPQLLKEKSEILLAVKHSTWAPAQWIHSKCAVGSEVQVRVGGNFFYDPDLNHQKLNCILLIAGGVGINPLISIAKHLAEISHKNRNNFPDLITLLYSCRRAEDLLFQDEINEIAGKLEGFKAQYYITREAENNGEPNGFRISEAVIKKVLESSTNNITDCFLCGPPPMIDNIVQILKKLNVAEENIHYEKWW